MEQITEVVKFFHDAVGALGMGAALLYIWYCLFKGNSLKSFIINAGKVGAVFICVVAVLLILQDLLSLIPTPNQVQSYLKNKHVADSTAHVIELREKHFQDSLAVVTKKDTVYFKETVSSPTSSPTVKKKETVKDEVIIEKVEDGKEYTVTIEGTEYTLTSECKCESR